ncbi:MAG TPA: pyridoxal-phosphate dependent enzyme [Actinocatenispora sp.]
MKKTRLDTARIGSAREVIDPTFLDTPLYRCEALEPVLGCRVSIKLETTNPVRSFKGRGTELVASQLDDSGQRNVVCASAGNLGQALAWSGRKRGIDVTVVASRFATAAKLDRIRALGARLELVDGDHETARERAAAIARYDGIRLLEDSLDIETWEGPATIGLELVDPEPSSFSACSGPACRDGEYRNRPGRPHLSPPGCPSRRPAACRPGWPWWYSRDLPASRDAGRPVARHRRGVTVRCVLVDDSVPFLRAAVGLLERQGVDVVGVARDGAEALARTVQLRPDVVLVDIDLGEQSGFDVVGRLARSDPDAALIVISSHSGADFADLVEQGPAVGFLDKSALSGDAIRDLL